MLLYAEHERSEVINAHLLAEKYYNDQIVRCPVVANLNI